MSRSTSNQLTTIRHAALIAALLACAGSAAADTATSGGGKAGPVAQGPTADEIAAVRATFIAGHDQPQAKPIPQAAERPVRTASWDQPAPDVPADMRAAELPNFYLYMGKPVTMNLDTARLAVRFAGLDSKADSTPLLVALAKLNIAAKSVRPVGVADWWFVEFNAPLGDAGAINAALDLALTDPSFEFASPVFEHATIRGGFYLVTPEVNIRVREAEVANADAIVSRVAEGFARIDGELGGLKGARQVRAEDRNGFRVLKAANEMALDPRIAWAEPDSVSTMELHFVPNDDFWGFGSMWGWEQANDIDTDAEAAWDLTRGNPAVRVLVMDCGVEQNHPDINQLTGRDFTTGAAGGVGDGDPAGNCDNHGTSVAGIISGRINNGIGGAGVAPNCRVMSAKTATEQTNPCSSSYAAFSGSWVANALEWGENSGCIISNSSFGVGSSATIANAYDDKEANGMIHFASAGNGGADNVGDPTLGYPSSLSSVQAVAAIDFDGGRSSFSNWGTGLQFACPGTNVRSADRQGTLGYNGSTTANGGDYATFGGTSAASPFCAGVCAIIWGAFPDMWPASVLSLMRTSCRDLGAAGYDTGYGWGLPNANFALRFPGPNHMWCDEAINITSAAYNPDTYSTGGANAANDEPQENCEASAAGISHSVWYAYVPQCSGTLDINTHGSNYDTVLAVFRGSCISATQVGCNDDFGGQLTSQVTDLSVIAGFTYLIKVSAYGANGAGGTLDFNFAYTPTPPVNDVCADSTTIIFNSYTGTRCTRGATSGSCEEADCGTGAGGTVKSVWWEFTPSVTGWADLDTNGSEYDTVLSVWSGCPLGLLFNGQITCLDRDLVCDDDGGDGLNSLLVNVPLRKGNTYRVRVAGYGSANPGGDMTLHFAFAPCPADFNLSGGVSVQDIFDFLTAYFAGNLAADMNDSGTVTVQDIFDYLSFYFGANCA
ncbi:MAG: S8 family serine peptidase [Phycisphaerales bacterium]|nr:S8 family serine peptidase [Phycisphaerales bacterium]